ncbi:protein FAM234A [Trichomycterus rosablanca]|uniref:protein FAM234A n=1 Tax=Trichomycterus rosablanca TaxID=2290929 RepID=UPI002F3557F3
MSDSVERTMEAEPLKGGQEEVGKPNGHGCAGKVGISKMSGCRTAIFLVSVFLCLSVIFAFSFILPCPVRPQYLHSWNVTLPAAATYDFLAVADASKDKVQDVFFIYKSAEGRMNRNCTDEGLSSPCLFVLAVDGTKGRTIWEQPLSAEFAWAQCDVGEVGDKRKICLVAHDDDKLTAINIYTGEILWQRSRPTAANSSFPVISLPDLDKDEISDIAVLSYPAHNTTLVELVFLSGKSGNMTGSKVDVNMALGRMIAHHHYATSSQAQYLLLHTDSGLFALGMWRLAESAQVQSKLKQEKSWEKKADTAGLIPLYSSDSLQRVMKVNVGSSSSSPPLLLLTDSTLMLFNTHTFTITWSTNTTNTSNLLSTPSFGHFNKDGVLDIMLEEDLKNETKRVLVINGQTGSELWEVHLPFQSQNPRPASVLTNNYYSVFMMWGDSYTRPNDTSLVNGERSLYLLYPLHSNVLLEKRIPSQNITAFKATLLERGRHACYFILTGENGGAGFQGEEPVILTKRKVKGNVSRSAVLKVSGADGLSEDVSPQLAESVREAFHRLRFSSDQ